MLLPLASGLDFTVATASECVGVGASIFLAFLDESLLDECVEIRVEPTVVDLFFVVVFEVLLDCEAVGLVKASNYVQQVALEASQIIYRSTY